MEKIMGLTKNAIKIIKLFCILAIPYGALAVNGPDTLFVPVSFERVGGSHEFSKSSFTYFCDINDMAVSDLDNDGDNDLILVSGGRYGIVETFAYTDLSANGGTKLPGEKCGANYTGSLRPGHHLYNRDAVDPGVVVNPNVKAGSVGDHLGRNYAGSSLAWLENDGFGNFALHFIPASFESGTRISVADLDKDGDNDFVICGNIPHKILWYRNRFLQDGSATFDEIFLANNTIWGTGTWLFDRPNMVDIGDFDNDKNLDVLVAGFSAWSVNYENPQYHFFPGQGPGLGPAPAAGSFAAGGTTPNDENGSTVRGIWVFEGGIYKRPNTGRLHDLVVVDFDNDGWTDFITMAWWTRFFRNEHDSKGRIFDHRQPGGGFRRLSVGDMNGDKLNDMVAADAEIGHRVCVFLTDNAAFNSWTMITLPESDALMGADINGNEEDMIPVSRPMVVDINNDGFLDVIVASRYNKFTQNYINSGRDCTTMIWVSRHKDRNSNGVIESNEMFWDTVPLVEPTFIGETHSISNASLVVADFDGDNDLDIIRSFRFAPLMLFQNIWNTHRRVRIDAETTRGNNAQKVTTWLSVLGSSTTVVPIGPATTQSVGKNE